MLIGRKRMTDSMELLIVLLGQYGFSAECISNEVYHKTGQSFSHTRIYQVLREHGVSIRAYRNGQTKESRQVIRSAIGGTKKSRTVKDSTAKLPTDS